VAGEKPVAFAQDEVADGAFGEFVPLVEEEDFVEACGDGLFVALVVEVAARGLVAEEEVGGEGVFGAMRIRPVGWAGANGAGVRVVWPSG